MVLGFDGADAPPPYPHAPGAPEGDSDDDEKKGPGGSGPPPPPPHVDPPTNDDDDFDALSARFNNLRN